MDQQDALGVEQITKLKKYIILQERGKKIYRCFILSFHKEFNRYWISCVLYKRPQKKY